MKTKEERSGIYGAEIIVPIPVENPVPRGKIAAPNTTEDTDLKAKLRRSAEERAEIAVELGSKGSA